VQIKKKGKQTLMFHNRKNIILFWIIFMGRTEAFYNSQPVDQNGGAEPLLLPDENIADSSAIKADGNKPSDQKRVRRSKSKPNDKKQ
jgi:hypothetical protein